MEWKGLESDRKREVKGQEIVVNVQENDCKGQETDRKKVGKGQEKIMITGGKGYS